jgi:hypothetical protein
MSPVEMIMIVVRMFLVLRLALLRAGLGVEIHGERRVHVGALVSSGF